MQVLLINQYCIYAGLEKSRTEISCMFMFSFLTLLLFTRLLKGTTKCFKFVIFNQINWLC